MTSTITSHGTTDSPQTDAKPTSTSNSRCDASFDAVAEAFTGSRRYDVEIVVPVHNEQAVLAASITQLHAFLADGFPLRMLVTIADNASCDATWDEAVRLTTTLPDVRAVHLPIKGRGNALRAVWATSSAPVVGYMDVDLSSDLAGLLPLLTPLVSGRGELAIGTRLAPQSRVVRGVKREVISRGYNTLLHCTLGTTFSDAQCGFKALRTDCARALLPYVQDTGWFFDTELLVLAQRSGLHIAEVAVDWVDDPDSRVDIWRTARDDLRGIGRVGWALACHRLPLAQLRAAARGDTQLAGVPHDLPRHATRFAAVGVLSTLLYLLAFLPLRSAVGLQSANLLALLVSAVINTGVNRAFTFGVRGRGRARDQLHGLAAFAVSLALTSLALATAPLVTPAWRDQVELVAVIVANGVATAARFELFRHWIFRTRR